MRNRRPSFIRREPEAAPGGGGGAVVATRAKFDPALHDAEIEPMDEAAIAALLTKVPHARPCPLDIRDHAVDDALGRVRTRLTPS